MKTKRIAFISSLFVSCLISASIQSANNSFITRLKITSGLGQIRIPYLTKRVSVDCSLDLINRPMTIDDVAGFVGQRLSKIGADLLVASTIAKGLGIRLFNYINENPMDATIIAGSLVAAYLITTSIIKALTVTRCPCCYRVQHEGN